MSEAVPPLPRPAPPRAGSLVPLLAVLLLGATFWLLPAPAAAPAAVPDVQPPHVWQPGVLRVGVDAGYPPFASQAGGTFSGHDIDLARRLAAHLGWRVEFVNIPFDGLYDALRVSRIDVIVSALPPQEEMVGAVIYSRPYFQAGEVLIVPAGRPPGGLNGRTVGVELGSVGDQTARRLLAEGGAFTLRSHYRSTEAALADLAAGRLDGVVADRVTALRLAGAWPGLTIAPGLLSDVPYVIGLPFDAPEMARRVDAWLTRLERDGTLGALTDRYLR
jgi:polar amino acid transport system substrate-binding protein